VQRPTRSTREAFARLAALSALWLAFAAAAQPQGRPTWERVEPQRVRYLVESPADPARALQVGIVCERGDARIELLASKPWGDTTTVHVDIDQWVLAVRFWTRLPADMGLYRAAFSLSGSGAAELLHRMRAGNWLTLSFEDGGEVESYRISLRGVTRATRGFEPCLPGRP